MYVQCAPDESVPPYHAERYKYSDIMLIENPAQVGWLYQHRFHDFYSMRNVVHLGSPVRYDTFLLAQRPWYDDKATGPTFIIAAGCRWFSYWDAKEHWLYRANDKALPSTHRMRANYMLSVLLYAEDLLIERTQCKPSRRTTPER